MSFDHERLDVFQASLNFAKLSTLLIESFPPGKSHLSDQLRRASLSISLNVAEGAGEFSRSEKARFYRMAKRSATECAAVIAVCEKLELGSSKLWVECRSILHSIVSMLVKLIKSMSSKNLGQGQGQGHR